ncbi:MAG: zinc-binding dehydrogenase, partial [Pseudomonadota bacterium]
MSLPTTMRALIQRHNGYADTSTGPLIEDAAPWLELTEIPVPSPAEGQVVVRVGMASVNPSDIHFIKGEYGQPRIKGAPAGFEAMGEVVAGAGAYAESLVGRRVAFAASASGAWAEYAMTDARTCIPLRPDVTDQDGAAQIVNPLTAMAMFDLVRQAKAESFIATAAASQLGKLLCGLAKDEGLPCIATVRRESQVEMLKEKGAAEVLVTTAPDLMERFAALAKTMKPRVMLDAVGDQTVADLFFAMPNGARWVNYGKLATEPPALTQLGQLIFMRKRIEGFWLTQWMRETAMEDQVRVIQEVQARFADGRWSTDVTAVLGLEEAMTDLPAKLAEPDGKVMI